MRAAILGVVATTVLGGQAMAADYLRGSTYEPPPTYSPFRWSGWYIGGQAGYTNVEYDFSASTRSLAANLLRALLVEQEFNVSRLPNLPGRDRRVFSYGGFAGYNAQWGDVVLGTELNYNHTSASASTSEVIGRAFTTAGNIRNDVLLVSNATANLTDFGSLRFRAGYAMGWIMPYAMVGVSMGLVNYTRSVNVQLMETDMNTTPPTPGGTLNEIANDRRNNAFTWGFAAGAGVDVALTQNVFLRGEYEYLYLTPVGGIKFHLNTIRAGAGLKF